MVAAAGLGLASVAWWWLGQRTGQGDLRPYLLVQFAPMLLVALGLALRVDRYRDGPTVPRATDRAWWTVLALYAVAKGFEGADAAVLHATGGLVGGHALKHVLAAAGAAVLLRSVIIGPSRDPHRRQP